MSHKLVSSGTPTLYVRSKSALIADNIMRATIFDNGRISADAPMLLRNSYVQRLDINSKAPEAQTDISEILRNTVSCGDLVIDELESCEMHCGHAVDTLAGLLTTTRVRKVTLNVKLASFAQNYARIFATVARTTVRHLRVGIFRETDEQSQLEDSQLQPSTFLVIREHWLDFVFSSQCEFTSVLIRHSLPSALPCPFSPDDIIRRFLDADSVDDFTACAMSAGPPEVCEAPVARRQSFADNDILIRLNDSALYVLYDVYYFRNERACATLSVLVSVSRANLVVLVKGEVECADEVPYPSAEYGERYDYYDEDNDDEYDEEEEDEDEEEDGDEEKEEDDEGKEKDGDGDENKEEEEDHF
ncbi:hypothetical protein AAVH_21264 [Aphelenchoides avenae]|nr:hypothetical protein AAVH_21264 [Aphelenchus avenae]